MTMTTTKLRAACARAIPTTLAGALAALLLAACGGGGDAETPPAAEQPAAAQEAVLLTRGNVGAERSCDARVEEFYEDGVTPPITVEVRRQDEADPATCEARINAAVATSAGSATISGPALEEGVEAPREITTFSAAGSVSASADATLPGGSQTTGWAARADASGEADGRWELRVQDRAVMMTITGTLNNAHFDVDWFPSAGGVGLPGEYRLSGNEDVGASGTLSHSVRLEPGQLIRISADTHRSGGDADARTEYDPSASVNVLRDGQSTSSNWEFTVSFTAASS
jgi:hypothetical protein